MNSPDYPRFSLEDFVLDDAFRAWVLTPTPEADAFWLRYQRDNSSQREAIQQATVVVLHLRVRPDQLGDENEQRIWQHLETRFDHLEALRENRAVTPVVPISPLQRPTQIGRAFRLPVWTRVAAAAIVLLLAGVATWRYIRAPTGPERVQTAFGQIRSVTLPDGSTVLLNGNSTLTFARNWAEGTPREVWLDGEGFFNVTKRQSAQGSGSAQAVKFIAHAPNIDITVLGTQFNVNTRRGTTAVTLIEGKVQLKNTRNRQSRVLEMKPGQQAILPRGIEKVALRPVKTALHDAWTRRLFAFEDTPLRDVAALLNDTYGLEVVFEDQQLAEKRFTGNLSNENLETLLTVIAATFHLDAERSEQRVTFRHRPD